MVSNVGLGDCKGGGCKAGVVVDWCPGRAAAILTYAVDDEFESPRENDGGISAIAALATFSPPFDDFGLSASQCAPRFVGSGFSSIRCSLCCAAVDRARFSGDTWISGTELLRPRCDLLVAAETEDLRANAEALEKELKADSLCEVFPLLVLGLLAGVGALLPPKMLPPLNRPPPSPPDCELLELCMLRKMI